MTTPKHTEELGLAINTEAIAANSLEAKRIRLAAAIRRAEGIWKDRTDIPKDGVEHQEQLRAEWQ